MGGQGGTREHERPGDFYRLVGWQGERATCGARGICIHCIYVSDGIVLVIARAGHGAYVRWHHVDVGVEREHDRQTSGSG